MGVQALLAALATTFFSPIIEAHNKFHSNAFEGHNWEGLVASPADFKDDRFTMVYGCG